MCMQTGRVMNSQDVTVIIANFVAVQAVHADCQCDARQDITRKLSWLILQAMMNKLPHLPHRVRHQVKAEVIVRLLQQQP